MAVDSTEVVSVTKPEHSETPVSRRRSAFRSFILLTLGLLCALIGQLYLTRQQYPLDGAIFYIAAILLFYRGVRSLADAVAIPASSSYGFSLVRALPAVLIGVVALVLFERGKMTGTGTFEAAGSSGYLNLVVWVVAMLALVAAYWRQGLTAEGRIRLERWEIIALAGILLLGLFLRVFRIDAIPGNLYLDEGDHGVLALRLLRFPGYVAYVPDLTGHATLFFYGLGVWIKLFGDNVTAMRFFPVLIGMASIVATYFLGRELVGPRGAMVAAFVMAISRWHMTFSHYIFTSIMVVLFMALVMYLLLRALRTRQPLDFVWSGLALALGLTAYLPIRFVLPAVVGLYLLFKIVGNRSFLRLNLHGLILLVIAFIIGVIPLAVYFQKYPDMLLARAQQASVQQDIQRANSLQPLKDNIAKAFGMFNYQGDPRPRHNLPLSPMLDPLTGIFFVLGAGYCLLRWRKAENSILVCWLVVGVIPGVLSLADSNPHSMRTIANLPVVCLLAALGVERSWSFVRENFGRVVERRLLPVGLVLAVVALGVNGVLYFDRQANDRSVYYDYDPVQTEVAREIVSYAKTSQVFVAAAYTNHSAIKLLADGVPYQTFNQAQHLPVRDVGDKDLVFLLEPVHKTLLTLFQTYYPTAQISNWTDRYGNPGFLKVTVSHDQAAAVQGVTATYHSGFDRSTTPALQRTEAGITADWASAAPLDPPFTGVWSGALYVSRYGAYTLMLDSTQPASVTIDSQVVLDIPTGQQSVDLNLYGGFHSLTASASVTSREGNLTLRWRTPDAVEQIIPRNVLYTLDVARNGLIGKYFRNNSWSGQPAIQQKDLFVAPNDLLPAPFSIEWEGKIYAPADGQYVFGTQSDDGSLLYIDNKLAVDNGGHHSDRYIEGRTTLTQGLHDLRLRYFQDDGGRVMDLYWTTPGGRKEIVPSAALFPPNTVLTGPITIPTAVAIAPAAQTPLPAAGQTPGAKPAPGGARFGELGLVLTIGSAGSGPGQFLSPRGVAVDGQGNIYVADTGNKRVQKLDPQGKFLAEWKAGKDAFVEPVGVAIGANGDIFVLEPEKDGAHYFSANGQYLGKIGDGLGLYRPRGLSIDPSGTLYFANTGGNNVVRTSASGQAMGQIGSAGKRDGQLEQPTDAAVDTSGNIFVADTYNQRIQRFTADGRYVRQWAIPASGTALGPHIAIAGDGTLYVTDPDNHVFSAYSPEGALLATWGGRGAADGQFVLPVGIAVDKSGLIVIADSGNNRIQVWGKPQ